MVALSVMAGDSGIVGGGRKVASSAVAGNSCIVGRRCVPRMVTSSVVAGKVWHNTIATLTQTRNQTITGFPDNGLTSHSNSCTDRRLRRRGRRRKKKEWTGPL